MDTDRNLLFGVLALHADLIDPDRFARACTLWSAQKTTPLADLLVQQGWLTPEDRADVEKLLDRKLRKHKGDARASLAEITTDPVRQSLAGISDDDVRQSLAGTPAQPGHVLLATTAHVPEAGERYTLSRLHATGGIGRVWLARDANLARDVALKDLRPERADNPAVWARFLKEARITGQLEHPGIVPIYEVGKRPDDQAPFYTMRFVRGRTLSQAVSTYHQKRAQGEATPLDLRELLGAFVGVCNAVAYAHSRGVLHRDLKPKNVVLGDYGEVIVLDWGLARLMDQTEGEDAAPLEVSADTEAQATIQGQVLGTPAYMAPEQAEGRLDQLGPATDVYGLGAILYEILSGKPPFSGSETTEVLRKVIHEPPVRPRSLVAETPPALEAVCLKALAKKPAERYGSASELASEIRHYLADEPVSAYPDPLLARIGRRARRHRTLVAGLAAAVLVAVVSLTAATVLLSAANRRESEARILAQQRGKEAEQESIKARANFQMAREAVEEYCTKVSDDPRLKEKDLEGLRKELLQSAIKFHQKFVEQHGDDPALRADLGRAYLDLGRLLNYIDQPSRAISVSRQAVAVFEQLVAEYPGESLYPEKLAHALAVLGFALDLTAETKEAHVAYERALQTLESARQQWGLDRLIRLRYVYVYNDLAHMLYYKLGSQAEAIAVYRKAALLLEDGQFPRTTELIDMVAEANLYATFGAILSASGQTKEGIVWCEKAVKLLEPRLTRTYRPAGLLDKLSAAYHAHGSALRNLSRREQALASYRRAVDLNLELVAAHPGVAWFLFNLGTYYNSLALAELYSGQVKQGLASLKKAVATKEQLVARYPGVSDYQANLVRSLANLTEYTDDLEQAKAAQCRAESLAKDLTRRYPEVAQYQTALVACLAVRATIHQRTNEVEKALAATDETIEAFRKAGALNANDHHSYYNHGTFLLKMGRVDEAVVALQKAVSLKPDDAEAQCNLGHCLVSRGRYAEGLAALQRGHELGIKQSGWPYDSASWVRNAQMLIQLDGRLNAVLSGKSQPADTRERVALALHCQQNKHLYAASARFFAAAFADDPKLAEDLKVQHRYNAACAAALAGCGRGEDGGKLDDKQRAQWRKQAREWLTADLSLWTKQAEKAKQDDRAAIRKQLEHWQTDADFAGVRDDKALSRLPAEEQAAWRKLWTDVALILSKVRET